MQLVKELTVCILIAAIVFAFGGCKQSKEPQAPARESNTAAPAAAPSSPIATPTDMQQSAAAPGSNMPMEAPPPAAPDGNLPMQPPPPAAPDGNVPIQPPPPAAPDGNLPMQPQPPPAQ